MPVDELPPAPVECDEQRTVWLRRYQEARHAGMSIVEAKLFAESDADISSLRRLVARGCPPELIARIAL